MIGHGGREVIFTVVRHGDGEFAQHAETSIFETPEAAGSAAAEWLCGFAEIMRRNGQTGTTMEIFDRMMESLFATSDEIVGITGNTIQ